MKINIKKYLLFILIAFSFALTAKLKNRISTFQSFLIPLESRFQKKNINRLSCRLEQDDNWSCGLRAAFHVIAVEEALKNPENFETNLRNQLSDEKFLFDLEKYAQKNRHIIGCDHHDYSQGLCANDIQYILTAYDLHNRIAFLDHRDGKYYFQSSSKSKTFNEKFGELLCKLNADGATAVHLITAVKSEYKGWN